MTWKKHFQPVSKDKKLQAIIQNRTKSSAPGANANNNFASFLPEIYAGHPQRKERYVQYDIMDQDSEVAAALDTISDFSTRADDASGLLFDITFDGTPRDTEVEILKTLMKQWIRLNQFETRLWRIFRNTIKYGDQFFIRDPETKILNYVDPSKIEKIILDETQGKVPKCYVISELEPNLVSKVATAPDKYGQNIQGTGTQSLSSPTGFTNQTRSANTRGLINNHVDSSVYVDANHIIHFSLSEGLDANWPFGTSILEPVFKVFKQKELLEDSIVIYRVQRAPERRIFYIDVGGIPTHRTQAYLDKVKMEIHQRRIPTRTGGGNNIIDATYSPLSMLEDYFFAQTPEGRGSRVETLPGGDNLGSIDDLKYFNNKLIRGLRVPSSYLPTGPEDGQAQFTDGRVGTAYIQEFRFANFCQRLQTLLASVLEDEFKLFIKQRGFNIDSSIFRIQFNPPQNFRQFEEIDKDSALLNNYNNIKDTPWISKRFAAKKYLGLSEEEMMENEQLWKEENPDLVQTEDTSSGGGGGGDIGLDSVGFNAPDENLDMEGGEDSDIPDDGGESPIEEPVEQNDVDLGA